MKTANEPLSTFGDGDVDDDRLVPLRVVLRWIKQVRTVKGAHAFAAKHLKPSGRGKWALAASDDSITLYTVNNLCGQAILAVPVTSLARAEKRLLRECRIAPHDYADVMDRAAVYAIQPPHRTAIRFANKEEFQNRLIADFEARQARAVAKEETRPAQASGSTGAEAGQGVAGSSKASLPVAVEAHPAPQKRTSSALSPPPPPSPPLRPDPAVEKVAAAATVRATALPPTKKARPPLTGPSYSSPAVMRASTSTPSVPGPPRPTAVTRPPSPAQAPPPPATSAAFTEAERIAAAKHVAVRAFELEALRLAHEAAVREGAGAFLALDVEAWEFDHDLLLEFGWSILEYVKDDKTGKVTSRRETQHVVVKENARRRNRKFAPDARDHFDFGRTITLPQGTIYHLLSGLFSALSATKPLFLVFHDPRMDLSALRRLGFDSAADFQSDLRRLGKPASSRDGEHGIWIVDTQALFSGWLKRKSQIGLERACKEIDLPTKRLHNAGNDARYTLDLFEHIMDRSNAPSSSSKLIKTIDDRAVADAIAKQKRLETGATILREKLEQKALRT